MMLICHHTTSEKIIGGSKANYQGQFNVVLHDLVDRVVLDSVLVVSPNLQKICQEGQGILKTFSHLGEDIFFSFYKPSFYLVEYKRISPCYLLNRQIIGDLLESSDYRRIRHYTQVDAFWSELATRSLLQELIEQFRKDADFHCLFQALNNQIELKTLTENNHTNGIEPILDRLQFKMGLIVDEASKEVNIKCHQVKENIIDCKLRTIKSLILKSQ